MVTDDFKVGHAIEITYNKAGIMIKMYDNFLEWNKDFPLALDILQ